MRRAVLLVSLLSFVCACKCTPPPGNVGEDGGPQGVPCSSDGDCPIGEACVEGYCGTPQVPDAATGCTRNEDCPPGEVCLPSTGQCITPTPEDSGTETDAGQTGTCFEGQTQSCGSSKLGECRLGTSSCVQVAGVWQFGPCMGAVDPVPEACNGKDDDCDGVIDDGLGTLSCGMGACARSVDACLGGQQMTCVSGPSSAEVCDGVDNDCDGLTDEVLGLTTCGIGACLRTVQSCVGGVTQTCTPGSPGTESCNGVDDDCNGTSDDGLGQTTCGLGICQRTMANCAGGQPQACTPLDAGVESCNSIDDNCNGLTDETCACSAGQNQACYTGPAGTQGVGPCEAGSQSCDGGSWGPCASEVTPVPESCNGVDDDCSSQVDDGLGSTWCGVGACRVNQPNCLGGQPNTCVPLDAGVESCNGIDDDCDTQTDEGLGTLTCGVGACQVTVNACVGGTPQSCTPGSPNTELCDGIDNNCNGSTDETFPQQGQSCPTGQQGICASGQSTCVSGALGCKAPDAGVELCPPDGGLDENCNGIVDDPMICGCNVTVDNDTDGANECVDCNDNDGTIKPGATEKCNGKDDNCNSQVDEGFDQDSDGFTTCGTKPGGGVDPTRIDCNDNNAFVFPLKVTDCGNAATPSTANGVDDNCNGYIDETCTCTAQDKDSDGVTTCAGDCNDNDPAVAPGKAEVCDGKDNDCNKATVDNCGVSDPCGQRQGPGYVPFPAGTDQCKPDLLCISDLQTGALSCHSFCNQTVGLGLNDSCASGEGCNRTFLQSDDLHMCGKTPTGAKTTGQTCSLSSECRTGWCRSESGQSYCSDACTHEAGCSANTTCVISKQNTFQQGQLYQWFSSTCRLDSLLSGTKLTGDSCTGTQCKTGADGCFNGKCTEPCCQHSDCPGAFICSIQGPRQSVVGGTQVSVQPACLTATGSKVSGQACGASTECKAGICDKAQGICVDLCCNDGSCPNGTTCELVKFKFSNGNESNIRACLFSPLPALVEQK
ncbi:MAG: putative metal-binding motif-containing protein [Myxococcales bacterium]|nr:putative metal-binding motif-containing protein [Myxococcales bacterium]